MFGLRQRTQDDGSEADAGSQGGIGANLGTLRERGEDLLSAGDDAIDKGLSGESQKFNTNVRQSSGQ